MFAIYLTQIVAFAAIGSDPGLVDRRSLAVHRGLGFGRAAVAARARRCIRAILRSRLLYGMLTAVAFALWPLGACARRAGLGACFATRSRSDWRRPRQRYSVATVLVVARR